MNSILVSSQLSITQIANHLLCCLWNIAPTCRVTWASEIMLDAVLEDICLSFTALLRILLGSQNNGLRAKFTVDLVQSLVKPFHFLMPLCVVVNEVRLYAIIWTDTHDDDSCTFIVVALTEDSLCASGGHLYNLLGGISRSQKPFFGHVPVLGQVFTEMVGVDEDADGLGY